MSVVATCHKVSLEHDSIPLLKSCTFAALKTRGPSVMTSLVETTDLSHSTLRENEENSMESLGRLCYLLIHNSYLFMCTLS